MGTATGSESRLIVCNTGPLLHLSQIGQIQLLEHLGRIALTPEVNAEWGRIMPHRYLPASFKIVEVGSEWRRRAAEWVSAGYVDAGEATAIALALELQANWFFTDDTAARVLAQSLGIEVHGSLGVVLACAALGLIDYKQARTAIEELDTVSTLWVSKRVVRVALQALEQIFGLSE